MNATSTPANETSAQLLWTGFIIFFFIVQAILWTVALAVTSSDSSHAVVAGYDQEALVWDQTKDKRLASDALGWTAEVSVKETEQQGDLRTLSVKLLNQNKQPIEKASIQLKVFHLAHAAIVQEITPVENSPGKYESVVRMRHGGHWDVSGTASVGDDRYLIKQRLTTKLKQNPKRRLKNDQAGGR